MDILYVCLPEPSQSFQSAFQALRANVASIPDATLEKVTLSQFADSYEQRPSFDLIVAECSISEFPGQVQQFMDKFMSIFVGERTVWSNIVEQSATAALLFAAKPFLIYLYDIGPLPQKVAEITQFYNNLAFMSCSEITAPGLIESIAFRLDCGLAPLPVVQHLHVEITSGGPIIRKIPEFVSQAVADTFQSDEISRWIFSFCYDHYDADFQVARTLCLVSRYAHRIATEQLEGIPLQFQCAIVPERLWEEKRSEFNVLLEFRDPNPRMSMKEAAYLTKLVHFSDGYSTLFLLTAEGKFKALIDCGVNDQYTRRRLGLLVQRFKGFIVATDARRQVWIHAEGKSSPVILLNDRWGIDPSTKPLSALSGSLKRRSISTQVLTRIEEAIYYLSDEHIGGFLVFHENPTMAAAKLKAESLREDIQRHFSLPVDITKISLPTLARMLSLDGAHFFDYSGNLRLLCQQLNPPTSNASLRERGTKHAVARKLADYLKDAVVAVISHDGPITVYADGIKTTWELSEHY